MISPNQHDQYFGRRGNTEHRPTPTRSETECGLSGRPPLNVLARTAGVAATIVTSRKKLHRLRKALALSTSTSSSLRVVACQLRVKYQAPRSVLGPFLVLDPSVGNFSSRFLFAPIANIVFLFSWNGWNYMPLLKMVFLKRPYLLFFRPFCFPCLFCSPV